MSAGSVRKSRRIAVLLRRRVIRRAADCSAVVPFAVGSRTGVNWNYGFSRRM